MGTQRTLKPALNSEGAARFRVAGPPRQRCSWRCSRREALGGPALPNLRLSQRGEQRRGDLAPPKLRGCGSGTKGIGRLATKKQDKGPVATVATGPLEGRCVAEAGRQRRKPVNVGPAEGWDRGFLRDQSLPPSSLRPPCPACRLLGGLRAEAGQRAGLVLHTSSGELWLSGRPAGCALIRPSLHAD